MPEPDPTTDAPEMTLRYYLSVLRRRKWLVILPMVVAPLVSLGLSFSQESRYRSSAEVLVPPRPAWVDRGAELLAVEDPVEAWRLFVDVDAVGSTQRVERALGLGQAHLLLGQDESVCWPMRH